MDRYKTRRCSKIKEIKRMCEKLEIQILESEILKNLLSYQVWDLIRCFIFAFLKK